VLGFVKALLTPGPREELTSSTGLEGVMRLGLADDAHLTDEILAGVREPFTTDDARRALADAGIGLDPAGFADIARRLPSLRVPVRLIYGEQDRILPDIAQTMERLQADLPHAQVTALPDCGHFLQEEAAEEIGDLLAGFVASPRHSAPTVRSAT
jgi:haloalkane dehalogenase